MSENNVEKKEGIHVEKKDGIYNDERKSYESILSEDNEKKNEKTENKDENKNEKLLEEKRPIKSYDNTQWIHSRGARHVRIMCEYLEVQDRLRTQEVFCTFLIFGSARCFSDEDWIKEEKRLNQMLIDFDQEEKFDNEMKKKLSHIEDLKENIHEKKDSQKPNFHKKDSPSSPCSSSKRAAIESKITRHSRIKWLCYYYNVTYELSRKLCSWANSIEARTAIARILQEIPSPASTNSIENYAMFDSESMNTQKLQPVALCTGGGPGMMAAANKGAYDTPYARSMGMGISLPFEPGLNPYVHDELAFQFHYFFTRKFWMVYTALCLIATPGGLGTMDELMEVLTLRQTGKFKRDIPVVLLGKEFWKKTINFDYLVEAGTISEKDRDQIFYTDSAQEAFQYISNAIVNDQLLISNTHIHKSNRTDTYFNFELNPSPCY